MAYPDPHMEQSPPESPSWGSTTKLVVGLTIVAIIGALVIRFRGIIGPLILAFILAYLLHPVAAGMKQSFRISWRAAVNLIYLFLVILLAGLFTVAGFAVANQLESLVSFVTRFFNTQLPQLAENLASQVIYIGPFPLDFTQFDIQTLINQVVSTVQPLLGQAGSLIGTFATGAAGFLGLAGFILLISYFLLADAGQVSAELVRIDVPGYNADIVRLGRELRVIWNSFLRGQLIIITLVVIAYTILMLILGVRFAFGLAILAGLARFVPYVGPLISGTVTALVAFFQASNHFGLEPFQFALLAVISAVILDQFFDNVITPRFLGQTLGVHPAAVLVAAIIAANLLGIIGLVLAAPVLATIQLIGRYVIRKMLDLNPWPESYTTELVDRETPWDRSRRRLRAWWRAIRRFFR